MTEQEKQTGVVLEDENLRGGFTQVPNVILRDPVISSNAVRLYALLLSYAWQEEQCFPGQDRLGEQMGVDARTVRRVMDELIENRLIKVERRGLGKPNIYYILRLSARYSVIFDKAGEIA